MPDDRDDQTGELQDRQPRPKAFARMVAGGKRRTNEQGQTLARTNTRRAVQAGLSLVVDNVGGAGQGTRQPIPLDRGGTLARGKGKSIHGVTAKQEFFCQGVANGLTLAAAYRAAYDASNCADRTVYNHASALMDNGAVAARINQLVRAREEGEQLDAAKMRRFVVAQLQQHATSTTVSPAVRVRALELLGRTSALFVDRVATQELGADTSPEMLEVALAARLAGMKAG